MLLYYVGTVNRDRIKRFRRTENFIPEDYDLLVLILKQFQRVVTTPNILTEVNSFLNQLSEPERSASYALLAQSVQVLLHEGYIPSTEVAVNDWTFRKYGLTDCSIAALAKDQYLVLINDLQVSVYLQSQGIDSINFNNIRPLGWT